MEAKPIGRWTKHTPDVATAEIGTVYLYIDEYDASPDIHAVYIKRAANRWLCATAEGSTDAALTTLFALVAKETTKKAAKYTVTNAYMKRLINVARGKWKMRRYELEP